MLLIMINHSGKKWWGWIRKFIDADYFRIL